MKTLKCETTGELIALNKEINKGGEAKIYQTSKAGFVAKVYIKSAPPDTWSKLRLMINNPPKQPQLKNNHISIVWPQCILVDNQGVPKGFLLPYIQNTLEFAVIYHPQERKQKAAGFNWLYLHTTAMNIACCVTLIHAKNYIIGDINSKNFLVKSNTYVSIIDTDSFQVTDPQTSKVYRCNVGIEDYTPPEMCGKSFRNFDRHEVHDRFGLAILIWQLLFNDHPFAGKWNGQGDPPSLAEKISQGYWVYGTRSKVSPIRRTIAFNVIHPQLQALFRRCFNDGHRNPYLRPTAAEWQNALEVAIKELQQCAVARNWHYYAQSYGRCYWCERKTQLGVDIFANPNGSALPNIGSSSLPTILKPHSIGQNIPKSTGPRPILPTPIISPFSLPKSVPLNPSKSPHPLIQWFQLRLAKFNASKNKYWLVLGLCLLSISVYATWQSYVQNPATSSSQSTAQNSDPKQTILRYYQLATTNRQEAIKLLSDPWRRQAATRINDNWWNSIRRVEVYAFKTFAKNNSKAKIKVWLKYHMKNGQTPCESLIFNLIFDTTKNQWLMDSVEPNSVIQNPYCNSK